MGQTDLRSLLDHLLVFWFFEGYHPNSGTHGLIDCERGAFPSFDGGHAAVIRSRTLPPVSLTFSPIASEGKCAYIMSPVVFGVDRRTFEVGTRGCVCCEDGYNETWDGTPV